MDLTQIAGSLGVPVAAMAAMGLFIWALWCFASGPLMEKVLLPLVLRHVAFLDALESRGDDMDRRRAQEHAQVMETLHAIAVKVGALAEPPATK